MKATLTSRPAGPRRRLLPTLIAALALAAPAAAAVVLPPAAFAYNVCHDEGEPCIHETMVGHAMNVLKQRPGGPSESAGYIGDLKAGAGDEDVRDHVFGHEDAGLLKDAFITITHFWDADRGPDDRVDIAGGIVDYPNAWQKAKSLWSMALGHYAEGNKARAYELVGHVAHLVGDMTVPTHAHDDTHVDFHDDDPYEEWMSGSARPLPMPEELHALEDAGPLPIPAGLDGLDYLMYSTSQIADFFPSMDVEGDTDDPRGWVRAELDALDRTVTRPRSIEDLEDNDDGNHNDDGDLGVIREHSYLRGIRAIAALVAHFEQTVARQPTLRVVFDRLEEDEDHDSAGDKPDYWTEVQIAGRQAQNRGDRVRDDNDLVNPGFVFAHPVGTGGTARVQLAVWDWDGWTGNPTTWDGNDDDRSDIDPKREDDDTTLQLDVDLAKCMRREPGAISGDAGGRCGDRIITGGDDDDAATKVYFRLLMSKSAPTAEAGAPYSTDEGADVTLDGTASSDPDNDIETYAWDLDGDGACDDVADDPRPSFGAVGQDGETTVKLCVTDATGLAAEATTTVTVRNVTPAVEVGAPAPAAENREVTVSGSATDPGWLERLSATIAWGDGAPAQPLTGTLDNDRPDAKLSFRASHAYGDNGTYTGRVCAADDDTQPCRTFTVTVDNTAPAAAVDLGTAGRLRLRGEVRGDRRRRRHRRRQRQRDHRRKRLGEPPARLVEAAGAPPRRRQGPVGVRPREARLLPEDRRLHEPRLRRAHRGGDAGAGLRRARCAVHERHDRAVRSAAAGGLAELRQRRDRARPDGRHERGRGRRRAVPRRDGGGRGAAAGPGQHPGTARSAQADRRELDEPAVSRRRRATRAA